MAVALLDSSAVVAYLIEDDSLHEGAVHAIERAGRSGRAFAMSALSWAETLHGAVRNHFPEAGLREFAADMSIVVLPIDLQVAEGAATLQAAYRATKRRDPRPRLDTPDALILATAAAHGDIDMVIAGDAKWAKVPGVAAEVVLLR